jgi:helicase
VGEDSKAALARHLANFGRAWPDAHSMPTAWSDRVLERGDLARAALLTVARSPGAFHPGIRQIRGVPYAAMYPVLEEAPRYLHWLAYQGLFGTIHPWCATVAADLERRTQWRLLQPPRGVGRLLWPTGCSWINLVECFFSVITDHNGWHDRRPLLHGQ